MVDWGFSPLKVEKLNVKKVFAPQLALLEEKKKVSLTEKEVVYVSKLAAIELKEEEIPKTLSDLNQILARIDELQAISTLGVEPTSHVHGSINAFRDDIIQDSFKPEELEKIAPDFSEGFFRVPKIIA